MRGNNPCHMRPVTFAIIRPVGRVFANNSILPIGNRKIAMRTDACIDNADGHALTNGSSRTAVEVTEAIGKG
jgi:hypothetical protein